MFPHDLFLCLFLGTERVGGGGVSLPTLPCQLAVRHPVGVNYIDSSLRRPPKLDNSCRRALAES